jgi:hypothetical protein
MKVEHRTALFLRQPGLRRPGWHQAATFRSPRKTRNSGESGQMVPRLAYPALRYVLHETILRVILRSAVEAGAIGLESTVSSPGEVNFGTQGPNAGEAGGCRVAGHLPAVNVH